MRLPAFRVPVIGFGFFFMAGVLHPVAGRTAPTSSVVSGAEASFTASPVTVSQTFNGWAFRCIYAARDKANGPALCLAEQDLSAPDHGKTVPLGAVLIGKSEGLHGASLSDAPFRLTLMTRLGFALTHPASPAGVAAARQDRPSANHQALRRHGHDQLRPGWSERCAGCDRCGRGEQSARVNPQG